VILNNKTAKEAEKLMESFSSSITVFVIDQHELEITVSIGITEYNGFPENSRDLMRRVDFGLQESKNSFNEKITISV
jgi:GGDEF domain-containing protein